MRILSAIVLLLWSACFFHCSAEQMGLLDCATCQSECASQDCESDDCPDHEGDSERPCGVCDFLIIGGAPTIVPLTADLPSETADQDSFGDFLLSALAEWQLSHSVISSATPESAVADAHPYIHLYEFRARRTLPVRGPNV